MKKKLSKYVCPQCGAERQAKPATKQICDGHSIHEEMIEVNPGVTTK